MDIHNTELDKLIFIDTLARVFYEYVYEYSEYSTTEVSFATIPKQK